MTLLLWGLRNWKLVALGAALVALMGTGWFLYDAGRDAANQRTRIVQLEEQVRTAALNIRLTKETLEADQLRARTAALAIAALNSKIGTLNDYADTLADRNRECLSGADVERLRHLWDK